MSTKTIGQLPQITPSADDKILAEDTSTGTTGYILYSDFAGGGSGGSSPLIDVTQSPYNLDKTGVADCTAGLVSAMGSGGKTLYFPAGNYKFNSGVDIPANTTIIGAGINATFIITTGPGWTLKRNTNGAYNLDWCKTKISNLHFTSSQWGIIAEGNDVVLEDLEFSGGASNPDYYAIDLHDVKRFTVSRVYVGAGGGSGYEWSNSGIAVQLTRGTTGVGSGSAVNYGYGKIQDFEICLKTAGARGIFLSGTGYNPDPPPYIESVTVSNAYIFSTTKPSTCKGIHLKRVKSCVFINVHFNNLVYPVYSESTNYDNSFISCSSVNCDDNWFDNANTTYRTTVIGTSYVAPQDPAGTSTTDYTSKHGPYDSFMPGAVWFATPDGVPKGGIRMSNGNAFYIIGDINNQANTSTNYDGMPYQNRPQKALAIDHPDAVSTHVFRPTGGSTANIKIGTGEGYTHNGETIEPLHRVEIADPLYIKTRNTPLTGTYNDSYPCTLVNAGAAEAVSNTKFWTGPGLYVNEPGAGSVYNWAPVKSTFFTVDESLNLQNYTLDEDMLGTMLDFTYSSDTITLNIPADVIKSNRQNPNTGKYTASKFLVRSSGNAVNLVAGTGVTMYVSGSNTSTSTYVIPAQQIVEIIYTRTGAGTAKVQIVPRTYVVTNPATTSSIVRIYPNAVTNTLSWTLSSVSDIDENPEDSGDTTYISHNSTNGTETWAEFSFNTDSHTLVGNQTILVRASASFSGASIGVKVYEGSTLKASFPLQALGTSPAVFRFTFDGSLITNQSAVRVRLELTDASTTGTYSIYGLAWDRQVNAITSPPSTPVGSIEFQSSAAQVSGGATSSYIFSNVTLPAGRIFAVITGHKSANQTGNKVASVTHPNITSASIVTAGATQARAAATDTTSRTEIVEIWELNSSGGTGTLTINWVDAANNAVTMWSTSFQPFLATNVGNPVGVGTGSTTTSASNFTVSGTGAGSAFAVMGAASLVNNSSVDLNSSPWPYISRGGGSSYDRFLVAKAAGTVSNVLQTIAADSGNLGPGAAVIALFDGNAGSSGGGSGGGGGGGSGVPNPGTPLPTPLRTINVSSSSGLTSALASAQPGDQILLADGTYSGTFTASIAGNSTNPITIKAANLHGAVISGTLAISADHNIFWGLKFTSGSIIYPWTGNWCKVYRCLFDGGTSSTEGITVEIRGSDCEFSYCEIRNCVGRGVSVRTSAGARRAYIHHNYFHDWVGTPGENAHEVIQLGQGTGDETIEAYCSCMYNLIVNCNVDDEAISMKSCKNTVKGNTLLNSSLAAIHSRVGHENTIVANWVESSGGIRIMDRNNKVISNVVTGGGRFEVYAGNRGPDEAIGSPEKYYPAAWYTVLAGNTGDVFVGDDYSSAYPAMNVNAKNTSIEAHVSGNITYGKHENTTTSPTTSETLETAIKLTVSDVGPSA